MTDKPATIHVDERKAVKCFKPHDGDARCCCNCALHYSVNGHPWVDGKSIMKPTGLFVCTSKERGDKNQSFMSSTKHGLCEEWTAVTS